MPRSSWKKTAAKQKSGTHTRAKRGKGGKRQIDGSSHTLMGDLARTYSSEPAAMDKGDPNYDPEEEHFLDDAQVVAMDKGDPNYDPEEEHFLDDAQLPSSSIETVVIGQNATSEDKKPLQKTATPKETLAPSPSMTSQALSSVVTDAQNMFSAFRLMATASTSAGNFGNDSKSKAITAELLVIYAEHAPEKQGNIPTLLAKYQGRENVLLQQVREKYCAKETKANVSLIQLQTADAKLSEKLDISKIEIELQKLYREYCPEKAGNIDKLLSTYKGREQALLHDVRQKYCPQLQPELAPAVAP